VVGRAVGMKPMFLDRCIRGRGVNSRMTPNILGIAANLIGNFVTVVFPAARWSCDRSRDYRLTLEMVEEYRGQLRRELSRHGERHCLDHIEVDGLSNWRVHFFPLNPEVIQC
jgi:hypothetical protein